MLSLYVIAPDIGSGAHPVSHRDSCVIRSQVRSCPSTKHRFSGHDETHEKSRQRNGWHISFAHVPSAKHAKARYPRTSTAAAANRQQRKHCDTSTAGVLRSQAMCQHGETLINDTME